MLKKKENHTKTLEEIYLTLAKEKGSNSLEFQITIHILLILFIYYQVKLYTVPTASWSK